MNSPILNGYVVMPSGSGMTSEHGSMYEDDVARRGGRVSRYKPGSHTFRDAMDLGSTADYENDIEAVWDSVAAASYRS